MHVMVSSQRTKRRPDDLMRLNCQCYWFRFQHDLSGDQPSHGRAFQCLEGRTPFVLGLPIDFPVSFLLLRASS